MGTNGGVIRIDGRSYPMGVHGFAADQPFEILEKAASMLRIRLDDNTRTRSQLPFAIGFHPVSNLFDRIVLTREGRHAGFLAIDARGRVA